MTMESCITLRLTEEQQRALRALTGLDGDALVIPAGEIERQLTHADRVLQPDEDAFIWECLNPYP
jgi:hypothetical protein